MAALPYNGSVSAPLLQRCIAWLAVLAILLVLLAPLVSRWVMHPPAVQAPADTHAPDAHQHHHAPAIAAAPVDAHAGHAAHHAMALSPSENSPPAPSQDPHAGHDTGVECDYCLIAARMLVFLVALLLALAARTQALLAPRMPPQPLRSIASGHLGARGPPLTA